MFLLSQPITLLSALNNGRLILSGSGARFLLENTMMTLEVSVFLGMEKKKQPKAEWNRNALYWKLPKGKKVVANSICSGCPEKVMAKRDGDGHPEWVTEYCI